MAEALMLTGHAIHKVVNADAKRCKMINQLKEVKHVLEQDLKGMKMERDALIEVLEKIKADVDMVIKENQSLERRNEELQATLEKEKEKVKTLDSKMDAFRELKMKLDSDLNERKRKNEKLQIELDKACLTVTQTLNDELKRENARLSQEADKPSSSPQPLKVRMDLSTTKVSQLQNEQ
ncbi:hypothetical protein Dimus_007960, partial [Dionaea muscipula]